MNPTTKWYSEGLQFQCQGSGNCCASHGEFGYVYLTESDVTRAAKSLKISPAKFKSEYCHRVDGFLAIKDNPLGPDCLFLKERRCHIYSGRPTQCRTWPFWPEVMNAKKWKKNVESFCPGVNQGRLYTAQEINEILGEQTTSEVALKKEHSLKSKK